MSHKKNKRLVFMLIPFFLLTLMPPSFANSLPVYWQGYPSFEVLTVDKNSPLEVKSEHLLFDLSKFNEYEYTITGRVTATYEMFNPADENVTVQMAFPFIGKVNNFSKDDISILADNENVPFEIYIGESVESYGAATDHENISLDILKVTETITTGPYQGKNFSEDDRGVLYTFEVIPKNEERMHFSVKFNETDTNSTKIVADGFHSFEGGENYIEVSGWCYGKTTFEIFVLDGRSDFQIEGYTDGSHREKTDNFSYNVSEKAISVKSYIEDRIVKVKNGETEYSGIINSSILNIDRSQIYRMFISAMDEALTGSSFVSGYDLAAQFFVNRLIILVYSVQFQANSSKTVSVGYNTLGTMDARKTRNPLYTFSYLLTPARYWVAFENLNIEIITPSQAPHIVQSSIELENIRPRHYSASLATLPENDLSFAIHANNKIKIQNTFNYRFIYSKPLTLVILMLILFVLVTVTVLIIRKTKK